ncbi:hypothetical protein [Priestia megaterium]|uniref:hypothetical protein n=1 Tax=Priestia megaterium TaxID=1404 RepID=UPI0020D26079|nr:hypothetical protein [Priestia megaterium]
MMKNIWMSLLLCMIFCLPFASLPDKFIDNDFEKVKVTKSSIQHYTDIVHMSPGAKHSVKQIGSLIQSVIVTFALVWVSAKLIIPTHQIAYFILKKTLFYPKIFQSSYLN